MPQRTKFPKGITIEIDSYTFGIKVTIRVEGKVVNEIIFPRSSTITKLLLLFHKSHSLSQSQLQFHSIPLRQRINAKRDLLYHNKTATLEMYQIMMPIGSEYYLCAIHRTKPKPQSRRNFRWVFCVWLAVFLLELDVSFESTSKHSLFVSAEKDKSASKSKPFTTAVFDSNWEIIETYAHDPSSFTQGLEIHPSSVISGTCKASPAETCSQQEESDNAVQEERLLVTESTGMRGDSLLRIWDLVTGEVHQETRMESHLFGEGSTFFVDENGNEKIAVLTYQEDTILVYDAHTLRLLDTIRPWPSPTTTNEGWGIAFDPLRKLFVVTDGSEYLHFWNTNFEQVGDKIPVLIEKLIAIHDDDEGSPQVILPHSSETEESSQGDFRVTRLNELEWDGGTQTLLANRWGEQVVLRIDPVTGIVSRVYNFWDLKHDSSSISSSSRYHHRNEDVFNGIAIVPNTDGKEWLVTGKWWPQLYRIRIQE